MWYNRDVDAAELAMKARVERLENYHHRSYGLLLGVLFVGFFGFIAWSMSFDIDEVARASGEVIASSRVQVIQSVDGGVISHLLVREGDRVEAGQELARLDPTRITAAVDEIEARLFSLNAKASRLRAEVTGAPTLLLPGNIPPAYQEIAAVEQALFRQRRIGLQEEVRTLKVAVDLAGQELQLVQQLKRSGDVSGSEILRARRAVNEADAQLVNRQNKFLEEARIELTRTEDEIAQNETVLTRRQEEHQASIFTARMAGVVKNIRVTTVGGVLRAGEEIMQIVSVDDDLLIEAKVRPTDIARIRKGLPVTIRFDPYDYTIFGGVEGEVIYVSADTLKEDTRNGEEIYYRVHVSLTAWPVTTTTGQALEIQPGMTAQVDIRTGDRTLMNFLLKPLRRSFAESFGER